MNITPGSTSQSIEVNFVDDSGVALVNKVAADFPTVKYWLEGAHAPVTITLTDLALTTSVWSSGGIIYLFADKYRLDVPNAAFVIGPRVTIGGQSSGKNVICAPIDVKASASITLGPIVGSRNPVNGVGSSISLEMFSGESKTFAMTVDDANGDAVDLSGMTLLFVVQTNDDDSTLMFSVEDADIAKSGSSNEVASVAVGADVSAIDDVDYSWRLLNVTDSDNPAVLLYGSLTVLSLVIY